MPAAGAPVKVEQLFNNFLSCSRPHESNEGLVGTSVVSPKGIPTATPISISGVEQLDRTTRKHSKEVSDKLTPSNAPKSSNLQKHSNSSTSTTPSSSSPPSSPTPPPSNKKGKHLDEKKQRRREQNRRAAVKSRKRKKVYMQELEGKVKNLMDANEKLMAKMQALIAENENLKKKAKTSKTTPPSKEDVSPRKDKIVQEEFPTIKTESAELYPQQMDLMVRTFFQHLSFLILTMLLAFGSPLMRSTAQASSNKRRCGQALSLSRSTTSLFNNEEEEEKREKEDKALKPTSKSARFEASYKERRKFLSTCRNNTFFRKNVIRYVGCVT